MAKREGSGTRADELYEKIRSDIFTARLEPGLRLKFPELCARYGTSVGPLREALTKLTAQRLVTLQPHLGYAVAALSAHQLTDLTLARVEIETLSFQRAIRLGDERWESEVVAAHHLLVIREREVTATNVRGDAWFLAHEDFHAALVAGCGSSRLIEICRALRAEAELYRRWSAPLLAENDRDPAAEHKALADAAVNREEEHGGELLRDHIAFTTQMLLCELAPGTDAMTPAAPGRA